MTDVTRKCLGRGWGQHTPLHAAAPATPPAQPQTKEESSHSQPATTLLEEWVGLPSVLPSAHAHPSTPPPTPAPPPSRRRPRQRPHCRAAHRVPRLTRHCGRGAARGGGGRAGARCNPPPPPASRPPRPPFFRVHITPPRPLACRNSFPSAAFPHPPVRSDPPRFLCGGRRRCHQTTRPAGLPPLPPPARILLPAAPVVPA